MAYLVLYIYSAKKSIVTQKKPRSFHKYNFAQNIVGNGLDHSENLSKKRNGQDRSLHFPPKTPICDVAQTTVGGGTVKTVPYISRKPAMCDFSETHQSAILPKTRQSAIRQIRIFRTNPWREWS
ncbi:MAG: hypothetical protein RR011_00480 [Oscillospiraceae bacterium]